MRENLVTFPAAAIRTSASLSRSNRTYAGTNSDLKMHYHRYKQSIRIRETNTLANVIDHEEINMQLQL